jgi:hypothetical protein
LSVTGARVTLQPDKYTLCWHPSYFVLKMNVEDGEQLLQNLRQLYSNKFSNGVQREWRIIGVQQPSCYNRILETPQ